jgi:serine/threonine-protein kinase
MHLQPGQVIGGRYRLERPLASGGMGTIWVATHLKLDVPVAMKFVSDELGADPMARIRFEREAKSAARLQSPHVVRAYDYGIEQQTPYMAMELLEGESLEARFERVGTLPLDDVATLLRQIASGLAEAHEHGIVHRDLKPSNLFMARVGRSEVVKILDFGIAKETKLPATDERTATGTLLGSPGHMSPEQARGSDVDARSDLWSVGVVMFRGITGERPFDGAHVGELLASIFVDAIPLPSQFVPGLSPAIDRFFEKAFARNPDMRFQTAAEMADAFDIAIGRAPEIVRPAQAPSNAVVPRVDDTKPIRAARTFEVDVTATGAATDAPSEERAPKRGWLRRGAAVTALIVIGGVAAIAWWPRGTRVEPLSDSADPASLVESPEPDLASAEPPSQTTAPAPSAVPSASAPVHQPTPKRLPLGATKGRATKPPTPRPAPSARKTDDPFFD